MKTNIPKILTLVTLFFSLCTFAQDEEITETTIDTTSISNVDIEQLLAYKKYSDSIDATFNYQKGKIDLDNGLAEIVVPEGYKFLDEEQANRVLGDLWGNPVDDSTLGMLIKEDESPVSTSYAIEISYSEEGYVSDDDADDIDYDDLLEEMQNDATSANDERIKQGYPKIELVGWASEPFYDKETKKLHWAKELKFGNDETNTLNYNIRVLGRKGYINLNVIGDIDVLEDVKSNLDPVLSSVDFKEGYTYADFDSSIDEVAAYGIGGLVAGKLLAKAGFFAILLKFWKFIAIGAVGLFSAFKNKIFGRKEEE